MQNTTSKIELAKEKYQAANQIKDRGNTEDAIALYLESLEVSPKFVPALSELVDIYVKSEKWEEVVHGIDCR
jgi:hypothetical protein